MDSSHPAPQPPTPNLKLGAQNPKHSPSSSTKGAEALLSPSESLLPGPTAFEDPPFAADVSRPISTSGRSGVGESGLTVAPVVFPGPVLLFIEPAVATDVVRSGAVSTATLTSAVERVDDAVAVAVGVGVGDGDVVAFVGDVFVGDVDAEAALSAAILLFWCSCARLSSCPNSPPPFVLPDQGAPDLFGLIGALFSMV